VGPLPLTNAVGAGLRHLTSHDSCSPRSAGFSQQLRAGALAPGEFLDHARKQRGVVFIRKDEIARFALADADTPHEQES